MNDAIGLAKRTWYPEDHPLHFDLHHPLGKLVGELGELLDNYMKHLYKPGYEWEPINELMDIWYYILILAYQTETDLEILSHRNDERVDYLISLAINISNHHFLYLITESVAGAGLSTSLNRIYSILSRICELTDLAIDQLTEASWQKLKPGSVRGEEWRKASKV